MTSMLEYCSYYLPMMLCKFELNIELNVGQVERYKQEELEVFKSIMVLKYSKEHKAQIPLDCVNM